MILYAEPLVARTLGVAKKILARARNQEGLAKGPDWTMDERNQVAYTPDGLRKLCAALKLDAALVEAGKNSAEPSSAAPAGAPAGPGGASAAAPAARSAAFARRDPAGLAAAGVAAAAEQLAKKSAPVWIEVTGVPGNTIIVHGRLDGKPVTVRVRSNERFVPGLWIQATPLNGSTYFAMVGNPPRWKGDRHGFTRPAETTFPPNTGAAEKAVTEGTQSRPDPASAVKGVVSAQSAAPTPTDPDHDADFDELEDDDDPTNQENDDDQDSQR